MVATSASHGFQNRKRYNAKAEKTDHWIHLGLSNKDRILNNLPFLITLNDSFKFIHMPLLILGN